MIVLSILIPTIPERNKSFKKLYRNLLDQFDVCYKSHPTLGEIEILFDDTMKFLEGGLTVGSKRDNLVQSARGKYCCFIDDDEDPSPNYIETLLRLCAEDFDIVTFRSIFKCDTYWSLVDMDLNAAWNEDMNPNGITKRSPFHICPIKTSIAQQFHFPDINNAEDWAWMIQVLTKCKSQVHTDMILHQYNHSSKSSAVDEIEKSLN